MVTFNVFQVATSFLDSVLSPFARLFRSMGFPIIDKSTPYDAEVKPCGIAGSSYDDCALGFDLIEHQANVYPVFYNRPSKQLEPNRDNPYWILPDRVTEENQNCLRETPILVVKPKSQRYIVMTKTIDFMYSQRFYPKVGEMFIRNPDGSIRTTMKDFLAEISKGNHDIQPLEGNGLQMERGSGDVNVDSEFIVASPELMVSQQGNQQNVANSK